MENERSGSDESWRVFREAGARGVVSAYFFGSYAEGRGHRESDVDVAALLDRDVFAGPRERFEERLRLIGELGTALGRNDVDLVVLNELPPSWQPGLSRKAFVSIAPKARRTRLFAATHSFALPT